MVGKGKGGGERGGVGEEDGVEWLGRERVVGGGAGEGVGGGRLGAEGKAKWREVEWNGWEGEGGRGCGEGREGLH